MQIIPKAGPSIVSPPQATTNSPSNQSATREKVIKMLETPSNQAQAQEHPVTNPTRVSAEELSAISPGTSKQASQSNTSDSASPTEPLAAKPEVKEDPLTQQYALLARKEKAIRAKVLADKAAMEAKETALLAREEALKAKEADYSSNYISKDKLKTDPMSVLTEQGVSYDEITQAILNPRAPQDPRIIAEIERLKAEVKQSREFQEQARKQYEDQQKQSYNQALNQIYNEAKQLVNLDPSYEAIKAHGQTREVVKLIEKVYQSTGNLLSVEEAAREVEEILVERAVKMASLNKVKSKMNQAISKPNETTQQPSDTQQQPQMKTLTNSINASKRLSAKERAILAFKGELK